MTAKRKTQSGYKLNKEVERMDKKADVKIDDKFDYEKLVYEKYDLIFEVAEVQAKLKNFDKVIPANTFGVANKQIHKDFFAKNKLLNKDTRFCVRERKKDRKVLRKLQREKNKEERKKRALACCASPSPETQNAPTAPTDKDKGAVYALREINSDPLTVGGGAVLPTQGDEKKQQSEDTQGLKEHPSVSFEPASPLRGTGGGEEDSAKPKKRKSTN